MPRVLISGYYGFDNLGDDTVLFGILTSMRKQNSKLEFAVLSNQPERTAKIFGIPAYNRWNGWTIFKQLLKSDMLVMGGGTLLQDVTSPRSILYYLGIVGLAKFLRKPVVFFAQGFGPIHLPISKKLIPKFVNQVDVITVRDEKSRQDFIAHGVVKPPIYVTADPALSINPDDFPPDYGAQILAAFKQAPKTAGSGLVIGVAIRDWNTSHNYHQILAGVLDQLVQKGHSIVFIPMQYPRDILASENVAKHMHEKSTILNRQFSFRDISSIISNMDLVIGMRLHSLILAAVFEIPFVSLSYDPKIDRFVQRMGFTPGEHVDQLSGETLLQQVLDAAENIQPIQEAIRAKMNELRSEAEKSAVFAASYLKK